MATLIQKLFKPKWQHAKAEVRLQAVATLEDQSTLFQMAQSDEDNEVRLAALDRLSNPNELISFFHTPKLKEPALKRFLGLLLGFDQEEDQIKAISSLNEPESLMQIATYALSEALRDAALGQIKSEQALFDFILASPSSKARQIAVQRIENSKLLDQLQKQFRGKDKTLVRISKDKRQAQQLKEKEVKDQLDATAKVVEQAIALANSAFSPTYEAQLAHIKQVWSGVKNANSEQTQRVQEALKQAAVTLKENQAQAEALQAAKEAEQAGQEQQLASINTLKTVLGDIKQTSKASLENVSACIKAQQQSWIESEKQARADKTLKTEFQRLISTLLKVETTLAALENHQGKIDQLAEDSKNLANLPYSKLQQAQKSLQKVQDNLTWPDELPDLSSIKKLDELKQQINTRVQHIKQDEQNQLRKIEKLLAQLENAISDGHVKDARKHQRALNDALGKISDAKAKPFVGRKHLLNNQLQELVDWQGFATAPKMEELCNAMEALVKSEKDPQTIADEINALQNQWKNLGSSERKLSQQYWERFKAASDKAYEPCKAFFQNQGEIRKLNKEKREQLCEQLETFYAQNDWNNADWKALPTLIEQAREEFKRFSPVDRRDHKILQERFNAILSNIKAKLSNEFESNAQEKQVLIDQATTLLEQEDVAQAIEECKILQIKWKAIPQAGRKEFQLWKTFREQCDALFNKRDEQKTQRKQALDHSIEQATKQVEDAKAVVLDTEQDTAAKKASINEAKQGIAQYELPKRIIEKLKAEISQLEETLQQQLRIAKTKAIQQLWLNARGLSEQLGSAEAGNQTHWDEIENAIDTTNIPNSVRPILKKRMQQAKEKASSSQPEQLLNICLELEISMGLESPASDKAARMALQVALLQEKMGQASPARSVQLEELQLKWLAQPASGDAYSSLAERFYNGVAKSL